MGTYLSKPKTDKESRDYENSILICGASSMQGWRESQEDAHCCLLDFDKNISLFAVFDGHGGAEVAQYAAEKLPSLIKNDLFEKGEYEKALVKAYLEFDDSLIEPSVLEKLNAIREENNQAEDDENDGDEEEEGEELNELYKEADMPIEDIILKYKNKIMSKVDAVNALEQPGSSKLPASPFLKAPHRPKSKSTIKFFIKGEDESNKEKCNADSTNDSEASEAVVTTNGVSETEKESEASSKIIDSSDTKVNGSSNPTNENNRVEESTPESSVAECCPSSSKGQNGSGSSSSSARLIADDSEDSDSDDEIFEASINTNDESDSEASDEEDINDEEDDSIVCDDEDEEEEPGKDSGCTAVLALMVNNKLYVANAGDSRCVVSQNSIAHDMSEDHKPEDEPELKRIISAGGTVSNDGRVNGGLNLSRALGDHNYKKNKELSNTEQMITALPDVKVIDLKPENEDFLVLACDGIWNSLTSQEVVDFVSKRINSPDVKLSSICEELFDECLAPNTFGDGTGCDNMTCIIIKLKQNQKRLRSEDDEEVSENDSDCKRPKLDSSESELVH